MSAGPSGIGGAARRPGAQVMVRSQGARDVALGLGALWALRSAADRDARAWTAAHALADATDVAATLAARRRLPERGSRLALADGAASAAVAVLGAARLGRG